MDGHVQLLNRGSLVTLEEFPQPISIQFKWRFIDHTGDQQYAENLGVVLRTSGRHNPEFPFEVLDGVQIQFHVWAGGVHAWVMTDPIQKKSTLEGTVPLVADIWHDVRITDDGTTIAVYLRGGSVPEVWWEKPVLTFTPKFNPSGHHVLVFNRERVAEAVHESHIDDFQIDRLPEGRRP